MAKKFILIENNHFTLVLNPRGGGIAKFYENQSKINFIYGYDTQENQDGSMGDILFPWAGRVENKQYYFGGRSYKLADVTDSNSHALHGFAKDQDFTVLKKTQDSATLEFRLRSSEFESKGYPFDATITIVYKMIKNGFSANATISNVGKQILPFGLGFHPYFCLETDKIDDLCLEIPADCMVEFDSNLKPTGRMIDVNVSDLNFSRSRLIDNQQIDNCFTDLKYISGEATTTLKNKKTNRQIRIIQDKNMPYMQVYSADTIKKEHYRKAIALEPQTCCGYALNIPKLGLRELAPRQQFSCQWRVEID